MTMRRAIFLVFAVLLGLALYGGFAPARQEGAQEGAAAPAPEEQDVSEGLPKPDLEDLDQIGFLTDSDYPPFNYFDEEGALTGFNVDVARSICEELVVECDVRAADWSALETSLRNGETDAVIASIRTTRESLEGLDFTDAYYHTPARFAALKESPHHDTSPEALAGRSIAAAAGTAHEAYLETFYAESGIVPFENSDAAHEALLAGEVDMIFGDGFGLMFWINGTASQNCCEFRGGAYAESRYFGEGVGIAMRHGERRLKAALNYALDRLRRNGRLEELYLRYFPLNAY